VWIERQLKQSLTGTSLPVRVLVGPRQSGKSALLARLLPDASWVSLDDVQVRTRAQDDPRLVLDAAEVDSGRPVVLDEAPLAPNLFSELKRRIDSARRHGRPEPQVYVTGSSRWLLDRAVQESLAGRASYFFLHSLSVAEIGTSGVLSDWLTRGGWPELYVRRDLSPTRYLADYVRTFVEKDIAATAGVERLHEFHRALSLLAARTGMLLNVTDVGQLAGVKGQTVTGWLDLLERNGLALRLPPYASNLSKRLVRTPKIYLLDTGLAAYLQGWQAVEPLLASPLVGALFETLVLGELVRARDHAGLVLDLYFWRTKEGEEIDFLVRGHGRRGPQWFAIEAKFGVQRVAAVEIPRSLATELPDVGTTWVVTPGGEEGPLSATSVQVPIARLTARLQEALEG
jgi:predicted AAA+ superfamily ATPase